jgi:hypothetical protein
MSNKFFGNSLLEKYSTALTIALCFCICQATGRYSEALILFSVISLIGFFVSIFRYYGILGFVVSLSLAEMSTLDSEYSILLPVFSILVVRFFISPKNSSEDRPLICLISFITAFISLSLPDRDWTSFFLAIGSSSLPLHRENYFKKMSALEIFVCLCVSCVGPFCFVGFQSNDKVAKSAILKVGVWATVNEKLDSPQNLGMSKMYSYSEMKELLQAESLDLEDLSDDYQEAWAIIPTKPLSDKQKQHLQSWIERGGHLIFVTDHTNLFGHASVINNFVNNFGVTTRTDSFFPQDPSSEAQVSLHKDLPLKTANTQTGWLLWPVMSARWISEPVDYSNKNFFGPMRATGNAEYGRRVIAGSFAIGKGEITLFGDSTIFANFAIYQPGVIHFLEYLRHPKVVAHLYFYMLCLLFIGLSAAVLWQNQTVLTACSLLGFWVILDHCSIPIVWPDYINVSGDSEMVAEWTCPEQSLSTAYSLIPLSGKKPRWISNLSSNSGGLWISKSRPPVAGWRWISPDLPEGYFGVDDSDVKSRRLSALLDRISRHFPRPWDHYNLDKDVKIGRVWTNDVMGDWWLDHGLSHVKTQRFMSWISFIRGTDPSPFIPDQIELCDETRTYKLKIDDLDWETLELPEIKLDDRSEVYLARGISAKVVSLDDGRKALVGTRSMTEGWYIASSWVLIPD